MQPPDAKKKPTTLVLVRTVRCAGVTVRHYDLRRPRVEKPVALRLCRECGRPLSRGSRKRFCSKECQHRHHRVFELRCRLCGETKPIAEFVPDKSRASGYISRCKECDRIKGRAYYWRDREPKYQKKPPRQCAICGDSFYHRRESIRRCPACRTRCYGCGRDVGSTRIHYCKACSSIRTRDEERVRNAIQCKKRDALEAAAGGLTRRERELLLEYWRRQGRPCLFCGGLCETVEHLIPLFRGGTNYEGNLAPACKSCNSSKGAKLLIEWAGRPRVYVTWPTVAERPKLKEWSLICIRCERPFVTYTKNVRYVKPRKTCGKPDCQRSYGKCRFDECGKEAIGIHGLCGGHYSQEYSGRGLSPLRPARVDRDSICQIDGCVKAAQTTNGYCYRHEKDVRDGRAPWIPELKSCDYCGEEFIPVERRARFCCKQHRKQWEYAHARQLRKIARTQPTSPYQLSFF